MPKANADIISKAFKENKDKLREIYANESFRLSKLLDCDWRVDQILASSDPETGMSHTNVFHYDVKTKLSTFIPTLYFHCRIGIY